jgi:pimeloyl-ACP methyl ester carboxylesterase
VDGGALDAALDAAAVPLPLRSRVIVFGRSMGSSVAVHCAALHALENGTLTGGGQGGGPGMAQGGACTFRALVLESAISSAARLLGTVGLDGEAWAAGAQLPAGLPMSLGENGPKMGDVDLPTLVLHGADDKVVPLEQGEQLHEAACGAPKRLVAIPGRGHNDVSDDPTYWRALREFFDEVLGE